jgi:hypothetical protein
MFKVPALISSPIRDVFENPGQVAPVIRVNGGKAPRSTLDQDVTSSLSKSLNKAQKTDSVTENLRYLVPGPSVAQRLISEEEGVMAQVLTSLTALNAKLDVLTEKSIQLVGDFKVRYGGGEDILRDQ